MKSEAESRLEKTILAGCVFVAFLLAVVFGYSVSLQRGIWFDEALTTYFISLDWDQLFSFFVQYEANMGLYYILLKGWTAISYGELWLRAFSFVAYALAGALLYVTVRRHGGFRVAGLFLVLFFSHYYLIRYGVEIRGYALALFFMAALWFAWSRAALDNQQGYWLVYAIAGALGVHAHLFVSLGVFAVGMAALFMIQDRRQFWYWFWAHFLILLSFLPLVFFVLNKEAGQLGWLTEPGFRALLDLSFLYSGASPEGPDWLRRSLLLLGVLSVMAAAVFVVRHTGGLRRLSPNQRLVVVSAAICSLPVLLIFLVSQVAPSFSPRFFVPFLPFFLVIMAYGIAQVARRFSAPVAVVLLAALGLSTLASEKGPSIGWKPVFLDTVQHCESDQAMLVVTHHAQTAIRYYNRTLPVSCSLPMLPFEQGFENHFTKVENYPDALENLNNYKGIWVFETHSDARKAALLRQYLHAIEKAVGPCVPKKGNEAISVWYCGQEQTVGAVSG
ncbi:MAG: glycosyltransferase family 39 protein [Marinobacter sp.]|uniref:glycosyltransferase family 39 protein n=1 Tax=Marinobacter sp. TaxID=50741 RepID=UPI00299EE036|nr:glycosyltransferase family 39 protein [Marinobacter sp.]MDX1634898.1 glycosyltransferase family 39 protein [Marinobacter sp.]